MTSPTICTRLWYERAVSADLARRLPAGQDVAKENTHFALPKQVT
jgi:hypothetical protein